jgi:transposase
VYNWVAAWRRAGLAGLHEAPHGGRKRGFDAAGEQWLGTLLASDPQTHGYRAGGWTVPLLLREAAAAGYVVSAATLRRTIHRLGWRWKRPTYVLGRPDPAYAEKRRR